MLEENGIFLLPSGTSTKAGRLSQILVVAHYPTGEVVAAKAVGDVVGEFCNDFS